MNKWIGRFLCAGVIVPVILCAAVPISASAAGSVLNIVSLGDSIARGNSCKPEEAYGSLLAQQIRSDTAADGYTTNFVNYGTDGDTTSDLLVKLKSSAVSSSIKKADIITISIGGNNLIRGLNREMADAFHLNTASGTFEKDLMTALENTDTETVQAKLEGIFQIADAAQTGAEKPYQRLKATADAFQTDMAAILKQIQEMNGRAKIMVTTVINPTNDWILGSEIEPYIKMYNNYILSKCPVADKIYVADCHKAFQEYTGGEALTFTAINWTDPVKTVINPHPTPAGHRLMEQTHYAQIKDYISSLLQKATTAAAATASTEAVTTVADTTDTEVPAAGRGDSPKAGEYTPEVVLAVIILLAAAGGFAIYRKKK